MNAESGTTSTKNHAETAIASRHNANSRFSFVPVFFLIRVHLRKSAADLGLPWLWFRTVDTYCSTKLLAYSGVFEIESTLS